MRHAARSLLAECQSWPSLCFALIPSWCAFLCSMSKLTCSLFCCFYVIPSISCLLVQLVWAGGRHVVHQFGPRLKRSTRHHTYTPFAHVATTYHLQSDKVACMVISVCTNKFWAVIHTFPHVAHCCCVQLCKCVDKQHKKLAYVALPGSNKHRQHTQTANPLCRAT